MSQDTQSPDITDEAAQEQGDNCALHSRQTDLSSVQWTDKNGDIFDRKQYAEQLSRLIKNTTCPYVIALSSPWGTGKTYFLNAWKNKVNLNNIEPAGNKDKIPCVYFSAWDYEYIDDPLLALTGSITSQLQGLLGEDKKLIDGLKKTATELFTVQNIIKTTWTIGFGFIDKLLGGGGAIRKVAEEIKDTVEKNCLQTKECPNEITKFKNALQAIIDKIQEDTKSKTPILIMVDELDRCKPDYVVKLLERIKHLFSIPGLVFILAIDQNQLLSIVEHTFGLKDDHRQIYLEKFIDLFYALPAPDKKLYAKYLIINNCKQAPDGLFKSEHDKGETPWQSENELYDQLQFHQQMYLYIMETAHLSSLRNIEKKFYKFLTIYTAYKPDYICTIFLLLLVMNSDKKDITGTLIIKGYLETKCPEGLNGIDRRRYLIIEAINARLSRNHAYAWDPHFSSFYSTTTIEEKLREYQYDIKEIKDVIHHMLNFGKNIKTNV